MKQVKRPAGQPADAIVTRHQAARIGPPDRPVQAHAQQAADKVVPADTYIGQPHIANLMAARPVAADKAEQAHAVIVRAVDIQVRDDMAVAVEGGGIAQPIVIEPAIPQKLADRRPARTLVPVGVPPVRTAAAVGVEVQVGGEFIPFTAVGTTHLQRAFREGRVVGPPLLAIDKAVAVEVVAHRIELRQGANLDQRVIVDIVVAVACPDFDADLLHGTQPVRVGCAHQHAQAPRAERIQGHIRTRQPGIDTHRIGRKQAVGQAVAIRIPGTHPLCSASPLRRPAESSVPAARPAQPEPCCGSPPIPPPPPRLPAPSECRRRCRGRRRAPRYRGPIAPRHRELPARWRWPDPPPPRASTPRPPRHGAPRRRFRRTGRSPAYRWRPGLPR